MEGFTSVVNVLAILAAVVGIIFYIASWFKPNPAQLTFGMTKDQLLTSANTLFLIALVLWVGAWFNQHNKITFLKL